MPAPPHNDSRELELRDYLAVIRRRKGIIALTIILVVGAATAFSVLAEAGVPRPSRGSAPGSNHRNPLLDRSAAADRARSNSRRVQTEIQVMQSRSVRDAVTKKLGYQPTVAIAAKGETDVVAISNNEHRSADRFKGGEHLRTDLCRCAPQGARQRPAQCRHADPDPDQRHRSRPHELGQPERRPRRRATRPACRSSRVAAPTPSNSTSCSSRPTSPQPAAPRSCRRRSGRRRRSSPRRCATA